MQRRTAINLLLEVLGLLLFASLVSTGLIMEFTLPPGSGRLDHTGGSGRGARGVLTWLGLGRHDWGQIHFWVSVGFLAMLVVHLALHWRWLCGVVTGGAACGPRRRTTGQALAAAVAFVLGLVIVLPFLIPTKRVTLSGQPAFSAGQATDNIPGQHHYFGSERIQGSMTLEELARQAQVDVESLRKALKLPAGVPASTRLGVLRRQYGFTMREVRQAVEQLKTPQTTSTLGIKANPSRETPLSR